MATTDSGRPWSAEFERQIEDHFEVMYAAALRLTRNRADAQDLMQEALVRALRFHHQFKHGTYMKAWLLTILRNTFINNYRKQSRRPPTVAWTGAEDLPSSVADKDMGYYPEELKTQSVLEYLDDDVRRAVEALPEGHRHTVVMADLQDMSYREIADALDCPLGTVMSRLHRGRRLLREALAERAPETAPCG